MRASILALAAACVVAIGATSAGAEEPVASDFYSFYQQVRIVGDRAYVAASAGLVIYDISDAAHPREVSHLFLDRSGSFKVEVSGNTAFVLSGAVVLEKSVLRAVDLTDETAPRVVGEYSDLADSRVQGLKTVGSSVIIANGGAVDVIDATNPTSLTKVGTVQVTPDPGQVVGLATNGSVVYAAFQGLDDAGSPINGVAAIDVSSPSAPVALGTFDLGEGTPYTIASVGAVVYVGQTPSAVVVIDATDPSALAKVSQLDFPLTPQADVFAKDERLFVGVQTQDGTATDVHLYDVSNAASPAELGVTTLACQVPGMDFDGAASSALMPCSDVGSSGMKSFVVSGSGELTEVATRLVPQIRSTAVADDDTILVGASTSIQSLRFADPGGLSRVGSLELGQPALHIQVVGDRAYVLTSDNFVGANAKVRIVDIGDPSQMVELGSIVADGSGYLVSSKRFFVVGETLYLATPAGLDVYDVTSAATPERVGSLRLPNVATAVVVSGQRAYVATLAIVDEVQTIDLYSIKVKKPQKPKLGKKLRKVDSANYVNDMEISDGRLYMAVAGSGVPFPIAGDGRMLVLDLAKSKPRLLSRTSTSPSGNGYSLDLFVEGSVAVIADGLDGVSIVRADDPTAPVFVRAIDTPGFARGIATDSLGRMIVADDYAVEVYDGPGGATSAGSSDESGLR